MLFLTRLYTAEGIGDISYFNSVSIILAQIFTLAYEFTIVLPDSDKKAKNLLAGSSVLLFLMTMLLTAMLFFFYFFEINLPFLNPIKDWVLFIPLAVIALGLLNISREYFTRKGNFKFLSAAKIFQSSTSSGLQVGLGIMAFGKGGLLIGFLTGRLITAVIYIFKFLADKPKNLIKGVFTTLKEYKNYPKYIAPTVIIDKLSLEAPFFLIAVFFSDELLGFFAIAYRVTNVPLAFIGIAIGQVYFKTISEKKNKQYPLKSFLIKNWITLALLGMIPILIIWFGGEALFGFVFGNDWGLSGKIAIILIPLMFTDFISSPTGKTLLVLQKEYLTTVFSFFRIFYVSLSFYTGYYFQDFYLAIFLFSATRALALIVQNLFVYKYVSEYENSLSV